jgi:predicted HAD superfamily Cof-like phosphohydrolase
METVVLEFVIICNLISEIVCRMRGVNERSRMSTDEVQILNDTLTRTQQECTRLLEENRVLNRCLETEWGLEDAIAAVKAFHVKFGVIVADVPEFPNETVVDLRKRLVEEEFMELWDAVAARNMVAVADGIADLIYVSIGMALSFGIPLAEVWTEVQRTNMLKVGGATRADGKILKPIGWQPPDIQGILDGQI